MHASTVTGTETVTKPSPLCSGVIQKTLPGNRK